MIVPYVEIDGTWTAPDSLVAEIFEQIKSDGLDKDLFYAGGVTSPAEFIKLLKSPNNLPVFILSDGKIAAVAWINGVVMNNAMCHFCVLKKFWGNSVEFGKEALAYWFSIPGDGKPLFDVLLGITPSTHRHAIKYIQKLGFIVLGEIPKIVKNIYRDEMVGAVISYKLRD